MTRPLTTASSRTSTAELLWKLAVLLTSLLLFGQPVAESVTLDSVSFQLPAPPALTGNLASNNVLLDAEQIHIGQIGVPHSYVAHGDNMYAVTDTGLVVNVAPCRPNVVTNLRPRGCRSRKDCGHLVSIRLSPDKLLVVLDAYRGVFEVHPLTGATQQLYDSAKLINGRPSVFLNDFVYLKDGTIIMSDSSPTFDYDNEFWIRFEGRPDGRLISVNPANGESKEILAGVAYPTGLEILDESVSSLLVSEAGRARILKVELNHNLTKKSFFSNNLPGMPEHIRKSGRGTYWVGLSYPRYHGDVSIMDQYSNTPASRNFLAVRRTMEQLKLMYTKRGLTVEIDASGNILRSLHDPTGLKVGEVLEATEYFAVLYLGTRAQRSAVRVVGSPNSLTVDSLVQVLRGRCKVSEGKVLEAKAAVQQRLKALQTTATTVQGQPTPPGYSFPSLGSNPKKHMYPSPVKGESPRHGVSISQGLSQLHKSLVSAPRAAYRPSPTFSDYPQSSSDFHSSGPQNQQREYHRLPPNEHFKTRHDFHAQQQMSSYNRSFTSVPFDDPFLPPNAPQPASGQLQKANRLPPGAVQQNTGSPNQPHIVHTLHEGQLVSHVILSKKAEAALAGNLLTPQQTNTRHVVGKPLDWESPSPHSQIHKDAVPTTQPQSDMVSQTNPHVDASALGGFMGFIDISATRNGASSVAGDQKARHDPSAIISMPDQKSPGHVEPLHSISSSPQVDQNAPEVNSFQSLEQFLGVDNSQVSFKQDHTPQSATFQNSPPHFSSWPTSDAQKRPTFSAQDMSSKDPTSIQHVQMFHPSDRRDQSMQSQNYASTKTGSFQQKASLLKQGLQQIHKIFQETKPGDQSLSPPIAQPELQPPLQHKQLGQNPHISVAANRVGLQDGERRNSGYIPTTQISNKQDIVPKSGITLDQRTYLTQIHDPPTNNNITDAIRQPLTPFSGAASIHPIQPTNNILHKTPQNNIPVRNYDRSGQINTSFSAATNNNNLTSTQNITLRNLGQDTNQNTQSQRYSSSFNSPPVEKTKTTSFSSAHAPSGYIQVQQGSGQYLLIPLTQSSLIQALKGLSSSQVQDAKIVTSNTQFLPQRTGTFQQSMAQQERQEVEPLSVKQHNRNVGNQQNPQRNSQNRRRQQQPVQQFQQFQKMSNQPQLLNQQRLVHTQHSTSIPQQQQSEQGPQFFTQLPKQFPQNPQQYKQPNQQYNHQNNQQNLQYNQQNQQYNQQNNQQNLQYNQQNQQYNQQNNQQNLQYNQQNQQYNQQDQHYNQQNQHTQQYKQTNQQYNQLSQQYNQQFQQYNEANQYYNQTIQQYNQQGQQYNQSIQQYNQPIQKYKQIPQQVNQSEQFNQSKQNRTNFPHLFPQLTQQYLQPVQQFTQPTQPFVQHNQQLSEASEQSNLQKQTLNKSLEQFNQSTRQGVQTFQQFTHATQQITQPYQQLNTNFSQPVQQFNHITSQFSQPIQQFSQPTQQFNQSHQQFTQQHNTQYAPYPVQQSLHTQNPTLKPLYQISNYSTSPVVQPNAQQLAQTNSQQFVQQPKQQSEQLSQQLSQQIIQPNNQQTFQQKFNNQPVQQFIQPLLTTQYSHEKSVHEIHQQNIQQSQPQQFSEKLAIQQVTLAFAQPPTQEPSQKFNEHISQHVTQQSLGNSQHFVNQSELQSRERFAQSSLPIFAQHPTQQSSQQSSQQINYQLINNFTLPHQQSNLPSTQHLQQSTIQQLMRNGTADLKRASTKPLSLQSQQPSSLFTQQSIQHINDQQSTQQLSQQSERQSTQQLTQQSSQKLSTQSAQHLTQQFEVQPTQQLTQHQQFNVNFPHQLKQQLNTQSSQQLVQQPTQQSLQQFNAQYTQHFIQQLIQQSPQQFDARSTQHFIQQPIQQSPQQFDARSTQQFIQQPIQQSPQQFDAQSTQQFIQQPIQQSLQQFDAQSTQQFIQQPIQQSLQQFDAQSTQQFIQQPIQQSLQQFDGQSTQQFIQQPTQQFIPQSSQQQPYQLNNELKLTTQQPTIQPSNQQNHNFTQISNQYSTQHLAQQPTPQMNNQQYSQLQIQQSTKLTTPEPTKQPIQHSTQFFTRLPVQSFNDSSNQQLTQRTTEQPIQQVIEE